jgi:hypothetical protein
VKDDIRKAVETLGVGLVCIWFVVQGYQAVGFVAVLLVVAFSLTWLVPSHNQEVL